MIYFSPSTGGFYDRDSSQRPSDAFEISPQVHSALLAAQATGAVITVDAFGQPVAKPRPPATAEEIGQRVRQERDVLLNDALSILDRHASQTRYGITPTLTEEQARQWALYAQALRDVPQQEEFPLNTAWPTRPQ